jgi:putative ABC transport system permease protein
VSTALRERPARAGAGHGGVPARRAVIRWAWRLFRREWRQQLLVLALVTVAVGATVVGAAVATNTPPPANAGFGTAQDQATYPGGDPRLGAQISALRQRFGPVELIDNQTVAIPGSIDTYQVRAQDPHGPFGQPMLSLLSGHYPSGAGQVAVSPGVAATFGLKTGDLWHQGGTTRRIVGIVENPQSLLDEFALVAPGQVTRPSQVTALFDAPGVAPASIGRNVQSRQTAASNNPLNPETIVLGLATVGMLLIALVGVGGFTVLAQRRLRALGMLGALGATDRNIRLVVRANGVLVGVAGALAGAILGLAVWLAYRPRAESSAHHVIGAFQLPWTVIGPAMGLAVVATFFAASRPARAMARVPILTALSGRSARPKQVHRSVVPGLLLLVAAVFLLWYAGKSGSGGGALELVLGLVAAVVAVVLLAPFCLAGLPAIARHCPVAVRLALRDLARYRARSASALSAITLGLLIAVLVCVLSAQRYGNVLDYAGPNLASNQVIVYTPNGPGGGPGHGAAGDPGGGGGGGGGGNSGPGAPSGPVTASQLNAMHRAADGIAAALGSHDVVELDTTTAGLVHAAPGRSWSGPIYVATPSLLRTFGVSGVDPRADILTMRPGLAGLSKMQLNYGDGGTGPGADSGPGPGGTAAQYPCPKSSCLANPVIQEVGALPSGTSAPNTVITEHAVHQFGLQPTTAGWLIQTPNPPTAAQITNARLTAAAAGITIETKSSAPSSSEIIDWATVFGIALALGILAMTVGLIRSETASDLRTLTATGASGPARRTLTAATAGTLALLGAVLGTAVAYVTALAYSWDNPLDGRGSLTSVPTVNLLIILVGMPLFATLAGWLLAGRQPPALGHQPIE